MVLGLGAGVVGEEVLVGGGAEAVACGGIGNEEVEGAEPFGGGGGGEAGLLVADDFLGGADG